MYLTNRVKILLLAQSDSVQQELKEVSEETVSYIKGLIYGADDR
jgi:hypothetical protein